MILGILELILIGGCKDMLILIDFDVLYWEILYVNVDSSFVWVWCLINCVVI